MAAGRVRCVGSPLFLKSLFSVGYNLTCVRGGSLSHDQCAAVVRRHVPSAAVHSAVAAEVTFKVSLDESPRLRSLLSDFEQLRLTGQLQAFGLSQTTLEDVFLQAAAENDVPAPLQHVSPSAAMPLAGIGMVTLPGSGNGKADSTAMAHDLDGAAVIQPAVLLPILSSRPPPASTLSQLAALVVKRALILRRDARAAVFQLFIPALVLLGGLLLIRLAIPVEQPDYLISTAQLNANPERGPNDPLYPNVVPALGFKAWQPPPANASSSVVSLLRCQLEANVTAASPLLSPAAVAAIPDPFGFIAAAASAASLPQRMVATMSSLLLSTAAAQAGAMFVAHVPTGNNGTLLPSQDADVVVSTDGDGAALTYVAMFNSTAAHGAPLAMNLLDAALYRAVASPAATCSATSRSLRVRNHPLPYTIRQGLLLRSYLSGSAATILMIGAAFLPASMAGYIVREREVGALHQQRLAGVTAPVYIAASWLVDTASVLPTAAACWALFAAFGVTDFASLASNRFAACATLFVLYAVAIPPFTYVLCHAFDSHTSAQNAVLLVNIASVGLMIVSMIMGQVVTGSGLCDADHVLRFLYRFLPGFNLGNGLYSLAFLDILPSLNANCDRAAGRPVSAAQLQPYDAFAMAATGTNIAAMAIEVVVYGVLAVALDGKPWRQWTCARQHRGRTSPLPQGSPASDAARAPAAPVDPDVAAEAQRVDDGKADSEVVVLRHLRKVYGDKAAVEDLTLGAWPCAVNRPSFPTAPCVPVATQGCRRGVPLVSWASTAAGKARP